MMSLIQVQVAAEILEGIQLEFGESWEGKDVEGGINISKLQKDVLATLESNNVEGEGRWDWMEEVTIGQVSTGPKDEDEAEVADKLITLKRNILGLREKRVERIAVAKEGENCRKPTAC
jgi:hypothetical protein